MHFLVKKRFIILLPAIFFVISASAQQDTAKLKNQFSIFNPTPESLLRDEIGADRPDETESPYTIDAGHFMYEADLFNYERQRTDEAIQSTYLLHQANLKFGLTNTMDFQIKVQSYGRQRSRSISSGNVQSKSGFGDVILRLKQNLYGNDHGNVSFGCMAYVKLPTNNYSDNKEYEGGIIIPLELKLPGEWKLGLQVEGDRLKDDVGNGMHTEFLQSAVISHKVFKNLKGFLETYYTYDFKGHEWRNFIDMALQYEISKKIMVDGGLYYGLQTQASKTYFFGLLVEI